MNRSLFQFCRQLAQHLLAVVLGIALFLCVLFVLHDSGESVLIHTVYPANHQASQQPHLDVRIEHSTLKLEVQLGAQGGFTYQRRLLET